MNVNVNAYASKQHFDFVIEDSAIEVCKHLDRRYVSDSGLTSVWYHAWFHANNYRDAHVKFTYALFAFHSDDRVAFVSTPSYVNTLLGY